MELLNVKSVDKSYGGVIANHDVSLTVPKGKIVALLAQMVLAKRHYLIQLLGIIRLTLVKYILMARKFRH